MAQRSKKREDSSSDGKIYYRIGEVSRITGVKPYVLRYWESEFRWMAPAKSRSKQRLYRKREIEVIQLIKRLLYEERYTIAGARKKLRDLGVGRALESPQPKTMQHRDPQVSLRRIRDELQSIRGML
jgi:DNA-binding transcriptional MerR regulator